MYTIETINQYKKGFIDMTAIVSILNKHAVAIAADSAVTFGRKVII